ncbi:alpha/beta fold hydrolase [Aestuariivivens sediminicola]|uniref:alpha/beta fold hydrolase n=1 Tax=Aestuariivivens sediminicola TaxID=2913560 RepID=UPI001F56BE07|nr:alpha/beta hydrolase [Aestuariivivens sediminicola]
MKKLLILSILLTSNLYLFSQTHNCVTTIDYGNNKKRGNYAQINGIKMYYETYGDSTKQPLLLIHGNGGSVKSGRCQIEYFKDDYFVIIVDSRYQGKSGNGAEELTYKLMTNDYYKLLNHLNLNSVNIIGQSDGGIIGLLMAIEYPDKVNKLIAAAPNLRPDSTALHQWSIDKMNSDLKKVEEQIKKGDNSNETIRRKALITKMLKYPNIETEELKKINAPVLLVFGDSDYMPFEHIIEIYENIPKANLFIVPSAGHRAYRLEPEIFNLMAERFFNSPFKKPKAKDGY